MFLYFLKLKKLSCRWMVLGQPTIEKQTRTKHVESVTGPMFGRGFDSLQLHKRTETDLDDGSVSHPLVDPKGFPLNPFKPNTDKGYKGSSIIKLFNTIFVFF
jgi:hypothetical protein